MRVTIDLMKKSTQIIDLSNVINPRVGDDDLLLPLHIIYGDNQTDMRGKDVEFLSNDPNKKNIYIAGTCNTNTPGDNLYTGDLTFRFPAGTFQADGTYDPDKTMFRIVDKETQKVISSVNVKITVMKNNIEFDFDPDNSSYDSRLETMLHDFHDKGQTMLDEIKDLKNQANSNVSGDTATTAKEAKKQADQNAGDISDLKGEVAGARGRFADMAGREDAQDAAINQKESIVNANNNYAALQQKNAQQDSVLAQKAGKYELEEKLAQMNLQPEMYADLNAVNAAYPNGATKLIATDDGYLALYRNGQWIKGPIYQAIGLDDKTKTAIANSVKGLTNIYQLAQLVPPYDDIRTIPVNSVVTYSVDVKKIKHVPENISTFTAMRIGFKTGNPSGSVTMLLDDKGHLYTSYTYGDTGNYKYTPWVASKSNRNNRNIYQSNQVVAPYDDLHTIPANSTVLYSVDVSKIKHTPETDQLGLGSILVQTTSYDDDNLSGGRIDVTEIATGRQWNCRVTGNPGAYYYSRWTYVESEAKNRNIYQLGQLVAPYDDLNTLPSDSNVLYSVDVTKIKNFPLEYNFGTAFVQTQSFAENTKSGARQIITNYDGREAVRFITGVEGHYSFTPWKLYAFENIQSYLEPSLSMFEHFAVIGDSYGSGTLFFDDKWGGNDNLQWGLMLAKKYGTTYTRLTIGGISTRTWLTDEQGLKKLNSSDPQDIYYLCLGINDEAILENNADYLGSVVDIDNGSDTFYGNYGRIIKAIQAKAPKARIIMFGLSQTTALYPQITKAIKGIAEYVHVPYQPLDDPLFSSSYYLNQSGGHPVGPVYGAMAEAYARLIKKCVITNQDYFRRYGWQG